MAKSESPPFPLTPIDNVMPRHYVTKLLFFPKSPGSDMSAIKETLQSGLAETLKALPLLSGTVQVIQIGVQQGTLYVSAPWNNVSKVFQVRDLRDMRGLNYADLRNKNFPVQGLDRSVLTPIADINWQAHQKPVMLVQMNIIRGGFILALCMHHSFTDANGTVAVAKIWAAYCRKENGSRFITRDMIERERLMQWGEGERANVGELQQIFLLPKQAQTQSTALSGDDISMAKDIPRFGHGILPTQPQVQSTALSGDNISKAKDIPSVGHEIQSSIFFFSKTKLAELKIMASKKDCDETGSGWISTNDALCSLFGCCIHSASTLDAEDHDKQAVIDIAVNMRPFLDPPLPSDSIGNVLNRLRIIVPHKTIEPTPKKVTEIAHLIRQKFKLLDQESYRKLLAFLKSLPDISRADILVPENQDVIGFSSWSKLNFYDIDWGNVIGTKIERLRTCILPGFKDFAIILPELNTPRFETDQCGLEILIWVEESKMKRLKQDQLFNRFAECKC